MGDSDGMGGIDGTGDSDGAGGERLIDVGAMLRALRRRADLSQRELAALSGAPQSTVARIESGRGADPRFRTVQRLVRAAGGTLGLVSGGTLATGDDPGPAEPSDVASDDAWRDAAGRRYPAHLDARRVRTLKDWPGAWWANWYSLPPERWPLRVPEVTFDLNRRYRDERRLRERLLTEVRIRRVTDGVPETCWRLVAELSDGDPVGELRAHERSLDLLYGEELGDRREVVLDGVLVAPRLQRLGIGRRLVGRLVEETRGVGLAAVCAIAEFGGARFLSACGFRI
ncbi:GNAT family N-acetyltransferase [Micromonospora craniellae]|uniref:GNAT family N-acetyltransferase n=1 Tax=Micromonospora craniellae TaxID=2294034 RepID=UPI001CC7010F|nr:GNAT family N-acetyltransferase [Micromonospora craniellae]